MESILLIILGALAITTSIMVILARNTVHSALWMISSFFFLSGIYILLHAEFIAILQIIVYAGAIMMFIIYAIMMLDTRQEDNVKVPVSAVKISGCILLVLLFMILLMMTSFGVDPSATTLTGSFTDQLVEKFGHMAVLSNYLFSDFLLPFEIASILLTAGIVGAVVLAKK
jgi:NADH-quinone oxidoreductase subunit J